MQAATTSQDLEYTPQRVMGVKHSLHPPVLARSINLASRNAASRSGRVSKSYRLNCPWQFPRLSGLENEYLRVCDSKRFLRSCDS